MCIVEIVHPKRQSENRSEYVNMSDETQANPRGDEVSTEKGATGEVAEKLESEKSSEDHVVVTRQDDSVFVLSASNAGNGHITIQSTGENRSDILIPSLPPGLQLQAVQNLKDAPIGYVIADGTKNGLADDANVQFLAQSAAGPTASMKTLIVMTPVSKGMTQLPGQVQPFQFAVARNSISPGMSINQNVSELQPPKTKISKMQAQQTRSTVLATLSNVTSETLSQVSSPLPSPCFSSTESVPGTPVTPLEKDPFVNSEQIPVVCRKNKAILDRRKLGSGQRGKCILFRSEWMTPSQFEVACGLSMSKDWKRSIRHGSGPTVQKLINEGYLLPHSAQCTCAVCSDDDSVTCPVRLFQPYKRRKRSAAGVFTPYSPIASPGMSKFLSVHEPVDSPLSADPRKSATPVSHSAFFASPLPHKIKAANLQTESDGLIRSLIAETDLVEQRIWWQLEEAAKGILDQAQRLNEAVAEAKNLCANRRLHLMQKLASQLNREKLNVPHVEPGRTFHQMRPMSGKQVTQPIQTTVQRQDTEAVADWSSQENKQATPKATSPEKTTITAEVKESSQHCNTCGAAAISECTGCHKATYCSTACQEKDWLNGHSETCRKQADEQRRKRLIPSTPNEVCSHETVVTSSTLVTTAPSFTAIS